MGGVASSGAERRNRRTCDAGALCAHQLTTSDYRGDRRGRGVSGLPQISGRDVVKALHAIGYEFDRQRGSNSILRQSNAPYRRLVVPDHKEVANGTLRAIIR
jgi:predicted RNA binding protein YcfA (HicA-like mRNA interferase family)